MPSFLYPSSVLFVAAAVFGPAGIEAASLSATSSESAATSSESAARKHEETIAEESDERPKRLMRRGQDMLEATMAEFKGATEDLMLTDPSMPPQKPFYADQRGDVAGTEDPVKQPDPIPDDPREGLYEAGICQNWTMGSSYQGVLEGDAWFHVGSREECAQRCDNDHACEQAMFYADNDTCSLGLGTMLRVPEESAADITCYGKHGFEYVLRLSVENGMCQDFFPGYAVDENKNLYAKQCDYHHGNANLGPSESEADELCHHWGPEFRLSMRGCWARCLQNEVCQAAEYDELTGDCKIGLTPVATHKKEYNRYFQGKSKCLARYHFGNVTGDLGFTTEELFAHLRAGATFDHLHQQTVDANATAGSNETGEESAEGESEEANEEEQEAEGEEEDDEGEDEEDQ